MEAIALMADIHANLPAAEAVIADIRRKHKPDRIVSLGDQVNLGPAPCDTLRLLRTESVTCLHGNHEGYILSVMRGEPGYAGANFASLRFNADRLTPQEITFEKELTLSGVTLCHAMPGDDRFPVHNPTLALPRLNAMAFEPGTHIVCGHGHNPVHYRLPNLTLDVVGSVGCMDDGVPGMALYAMLYLSPGRVTLETVVLLSKGEVDSKKIRVEFSLEDMDMSEFQDGATYPQIKEYVLEHTGLKVSNLYISQIKRKCGIEVGKNYNLPKSEDSRQPQCPPEKEKAIREALKYYGMI